MQAADRSCLSQMRGPVDEHRFPPPRAAVDRARADLRARAALPALVQNVRLSFYNWSIFDQEMHFIGLENYRKAFTDPFLGTAVRNNVAYAAVSLVVQVGFGLVLATLLDQFAKGRLQAFLRSVYFLPATISMTVTGVLFTFVYDPEVGFLNAALDAVGLESLSRAWLAEPSTAMWAIIAMSQWQWTGYITALLLVAIQRIPGEMYEAAALDGAGPVRQFFAVTVPLTREMVAILSLVTVSNACCCSTRSS